MGACICKICVRVCVHRQIGMKMGGRPLWSSCTGERLLGSEPEDERERAVLTVIDGAASCPGGGY